VAGGYHPTTLHAGGDRLGTLAVGQDEHAIPLPTVLWIVDDLCRGVEVRPTTTDALCLHLVALLPLEGVAQVCGAVERQDGDGDLLRQGGEFAEEQGELCVVHGTRLIDGDQELGHVAALDAGMDVGVALVDPLDGGGTLAAGDVADELTEDRSPVDDVGHRLADGVTKFSRDVAPPVGLAVGVFRGLLHRVGHLAGHHVAKFFRDVVP